MLIHQLPKTNELFAVKYTPYANRHYLKDFEKKYKGKQWEFTDISIREDLSRLRVQNNTTQLTDQIDEFKYNDNKWLAKYDFKIAKTNESPKSSGNRCVLFIDNTKNTIDILMIYNKTHLPKNKDETKYIMDEIANNYKDKEIKELLKK